MSWFDPVASARGHHGLDAGEVFRMVPPLFWAVGAFYEDFAQVSNDAVSRILSEAALGPGQRRETRRHGEELMLVLGARPLRRSPPGLFGQTDSSLGRFE